MPKSPTVATPQQTKFAEGIVSGLSKTEAYAKAHPNDKSSRRSLGKVASRASQKPAVVAAVQALWRAPIHLDKFPEYDNPRALRAHGLAAIVRLTQHPDGAIAMQASRYLLEYSRSLETHPETTAERQSLISDLQSLYKKALKQAPLIETVVENTEPEETPADPPSEP